MGQDIRNFFRNEKIGVAHKMPEGHEERFEEKLKANFPKDKEKNYLWLKIAAVLIIAVTTAVFFLLQKPTEENQIVDTPVESTEDKNPEQKSFSLSDISPEYKKVESYYLAGINLEISKLKITEQNKDLIDSFMEQLSMLDQEYAKLNAELAETGINEQTIEALIDNLKLRLELLINLKTKLEELKKSTNEKHKKNNA